MPVHDWSRVEAGLFHHFHHSWIEELQRALNSRILPPDYDAMGEQFAGGFGLDVLKLQGTTNIDESQPLRPVRHNPGEGHLALAEPKLEIWGETEMQYDHCKQTNVVVRHVSGNCLIAMIEIVSPGNKRSRNGIETFVRKVADLLSKRIHLLILDLLPPGPRDPDGIHALIWEFLENVQAPSPDRPLTLASYEADLSVRSYGVQAAVGDRLTEKPLFLASRGCVEVPLEETYVSAFDAFQRRWRPLLERDGPKPE